MRPGVRLRFWTPGYKNQPDVRPPVLLRLVSVLSLFSFIGVLVYAVFLGVTGMPFSSIATEQAAYIATLHGVVPLIVFYTVSTNSPLSRPLILLYTLILCSATLAGKGFLGSLPIAALEKTITVFGVFLSVLYWLYGSARMRIYYALISNKPVPDDLVALAEKFAAKTWLDDTGRRRIEWLLDNLETLVLVLFIVVAVGAFIATGL